MSNCKHDLRYTELTEPYNKDPFHKQAWVHCLKKCGFKLMVKMFSMEEYDKFFNLEEAQGE